MPAGAGPETCMMDVGLYPECSWTMVAREAIERRHCDESPNFRTNGLRGLCRVGCGQAERRGLSESLRGGQLKSMHVPSAIYRERRHLTQLRDTFVSEMAAMQQRIKSLLLLAGIEFPPAPAGSQGSVPVKKQLRELPCST